MERKILKIEDWKIEFNTKSQNSKIFNLIALKPLREKLKIIESHQVRFRGKRTFKGGLKIGR